MTTYKEDLQKLVELQKQLIQEYSEKVKILEDLIERQQAVIALAGEIIKL